MVGLDFASDLTSSTKSACCFGSSGMYFTHSIPISGDMDTLQFFSLCVECNIASWFCVCSVCMDSWWFEDRCLRDFLQIRRNKSLKNFRNLSINSSYFGRIFSYNYQLFWFISDEVSMNKWSLICSTFLGTINLLHSTFLFVFISSRYHITFQLFCHLILVLWSKF